LKVISVNQTMIFCGSAHRTVVKWSGVLDERAASVFIVPELFCVNIKLVRKKIPSIR